jgi:glycine cleavage system H lipoate-binding protein
MVAILVVVTIVLFIAADLVVQWIRIRRSRPVVAAPPVRGRVADLLVPFLQPERFLLPAGLFFHRGHVWANLLFSGQIKVGVDDFVQKLLGRVDAITLPPLGVKVKQGEPFAAIRQGERMAMLRAPVDGTVCAVNSELVKNPGLIRRDPYTRGWVVALRPINLTANLTRLTVGEDALAWLRGELDRLHEFLDVAVTLKRDALVGATAADGGLLADGLLERLDNDTWAEFQEKFLGD